jgi:prenylcysteine oxidase/farnesylcysteine lyase
MRTHWYLFFFLVILATIGRTHATNKHVCIVGSGMGGASASYFLKEYAGFPLDVSIFEERDRVGGRMAVVDLQGDTFEAGASIIHPKNLHCVNFTKLLGLKQTTDTDDESFGIWDGKQFVFQTARAGDNIFSKAIAQIMNTLSTLWRYGASLWRMQTYVSVSICVPKLQISLSCHADDML